MKRGKGAKMIRTAKDVIRELEERKEAISKNENDKMFVAGQKAGLDYAIMLLGLFRAYGEEI
jgi:hypothetical protein